jgi:ABC-type glutathione transport system ATPase component
MSTNPAPEMAILTENLVKRFDEDVLAVAGINLGVPKNSVYALLGPNGAGKTTTVSMLTTLTLPTSRQRPRLRPGCGQAGGAGAAADRGYLSGDCAGP